jgi:hypothetical protein
MMFVKVYDDIGFLAFSEPVLDDLREVINRALDVLESDDFEGFLVLDYGNGAAHPL